jgi:branched-chain amino acid transport system substrate-binding protein
MARYRKVPSAMPILVGITLLSLLSCKGSQIADEVGQEISIGAVLPLTGDAAQWGLGAQHGIQIAVDQMNAKGGINGKKVSVIFEDDQLQPRVGTQAMQKLVAVDKVQVVIGSISSSVTLAISPIAERNNVVLISPASTSHDISKAGDFIFRTIPSDIYEGGFMARFARDQRRYHKIAILAVNAAGTKGMADAFKGTFVALGGEVPVYELVAQGGTNFRAAIGKAIGAGPQAIYVVGFPLETGHMVKQLKELGFRDQILSAQPAEDPQVRAIAGSASEGLIFTTTSIDLNTGSEVTKRFAAEYSKRFGSAPPVFSYEAYDAAWLVLNGLARGLDGPTVRDYLYSIRDYSGASGMFSIDKMGDVEKSIRIVAIRSGAVVNV